ncbi:TSUP family transporter [Paraburkholderia youngii]|uniref:TSUP family transporter n=1 Tax=Paraburkholderia youngii TaxID=2782701 RepID=UPI003D2571F3
MRLSGPGCNAASIDHANEQTQIREIESHMLARGAFMIDQLGLSLLAVVPALAGMWLGSIVRQKISPKTFRRCFLLFLIVVGLELALHPFA